MPLPAADCLARVFVHVYDAPDSVESGAFFVHGRMHPASLALAVPGGRIFTEHVPLKSHAPDLMARIPKVHETFKEEPI